MSLLVIGFGIVSIATAFIHNFAEFVVVRGLLGAFEGGVLPVRMKLCLCHSALTFLAGHCFPHESLLPEARMCDSIRLAHPWIHHR